ncbi:hypothetical protein [Sedimenticola selenatireducens]|uniref:Uncharacterized protein n=1 Tax=Sedimenticola selenatireducens TaxID=191960 RepID=A0A558DL19_9GAMM|nr:hypothetical protein [Sedimenticola selenatireducens]TVO70023.1 hypothetical protein FHP88_17020 [Sedimenticola selenatireducens]TVT61735.1 MAG: hypothetical protein FHK78_16865 [Sedimenticola selenatireducens]
MQRSSLVLLIIVTMLSALMILPATATETDLMAQDVEGVKLGMEMTEAVPALENKGYTRTSKRSFEKKDKTGIHYIGIKLNPGGEVISVGVAHRLIEGFDADALRDEWISQWGNPDHINGNPGNDWTLQYNSPHAILDASAIKTYNPRRPSEVSIRLASKGQVLAVRRGHEVEEKRCIAIKDKPVSTLTINDRDALLECIRTGQLIITTP